MKSNSDYKNSFQWECANSTECSSPCDSKPAPKKFKGKAIQTEESSEVAGYLKKDIFENHSGNSREPGEVSLSVDDLLTAVKKKIWKFFNQNCVPPFESRKYFIEKIDNFIESGKYCELIDFFSRWPFEYKGGEWFELVVYAAFKIRRNDILNELLAILEIEEERSDSSSPPMNAYFHVLKKLSTFNGIESPESFQSFLEWLIRWDIVELNAYTEILEGIPLGYRAQRSDLSETMHIPFRSPYNGLDDKWGDTDYLRQYLKKTYWAQYDMITVILYIAPLSFVKSAIKGWLKPDKTADIRKKLFRQSYHPIGTCRYERLPWNLMLPFLQRCLPRVESRLCQDLDLLKGVQVEQQDFPKVTPVSDAHAPPFIFGRTVAFVDHSKKQPNYYFKFKNNDESDEVFFQEGLRLKYFFEQREKLSLKSPALELVGMYQSQSLMDALSAPPFTRLSISDKAKLFWRCGSDTSIKYTCRNAFSDHKSSTVKKVLDHAGLSHWHRLLDEDSMLPARPKRELIRYLLRKDKACNMMLLKSQPGYHYEKYIYDEKDSDKVLTGLLNYVEEFGCLWEQGVIGPDACSSFHDKVGGRSYLFLAGFFNYETSGSVDQWASVSTDYPNIGPEGMRDRGDSKPSDELPFPPYHIVRDEDKIMSLETLAKAALGAILLYGRCFREDFDSDNREKVLKVKNDVGLILTTLFSKAFNMKTDELIQFMEEDDLLSQTSVQICYWMTNRYVKDLRDGIIPETVFPDFKGCRSCHILNRQSKEFLSDEGFKGNYDSVHLGADNGINPLMALHALVIKLMSHGVLSIM